MGSCSNRHSEIACLRTEGKSLCMCRLLCDMEKSLGTSGLPYITESPFPLISKCSLSLKKEWRFLESSDVAATTIRSTSFWIRRSVKRYLSRLCIFSSSSIYFYLASLTVFLFSGTAGYY
jgi:hypothetical protein